MKSLSKKTISELREQAEATVLSYRGSYDAPGFDACVEAELQELINEYISNTSRRFPIQGS